MKKSRKKHAVCKKLESTKGRVEERRKKVELQGIRKDFWGKGNGERRKERVIKFVIFDMSLSLLLVRLLTGRKPGSLPWTK
jgi:hypothetical protein